MEKTKADLICSKCQRGIIIGLDAFTPIYGYFLCSACFAGDHVSKQDPMVDYSNMAYVEGEKRPTVQ